MSFKPRAGSLIRAWWWHTYFTFPEIHLFCNTCWSLGSLAVSSTYLWAGVGGTWNNTVLWFQSCLGKHHHRSDSMWGTDYIANPFFFLLRVSKTTIKYLRWQLGGEITWGTFGKFVTLLVQQLKKRIVHKIVQQCTDYHSVYSNIFLRFWTNDVTKFPKVTIHEERNGNVVSTSHWTTPVIM